MAGEPGTENTGTAGRSVRNIVHTSAGGAGARITLSNLYGRTPLGITHASIALAAAHNSSAAAPGTMRRLTFGGATSVTIPAGQQTLSDAVRLQVPSGADLLVTTYSPPRRGRSPTTRTHGRSPISPPATTPRTRPARRTANAPRSGGT